MSPRRLLQPRPIPIYWLVVGFATAILSPLLSILAAVSIAEGNSREITKELLDSQARQSAILREEGKQRTCDLLRTQVEIYEETPPTSPAGINFQKTWTHEYRTLGCIPKK